MLWFQFIISAVVIVFAGLKLTKYADAISESLNLGKVWVGIILLGFVTSLPEAITSFSSVLQLNANNLAVGNLLGSNVFNPMIVVILDIMYRQDAFTNIVKAKRTYDVSGFLAILLTSIVLLFILFKEWLSFSVFGRVSGAGLLLTIVYLFGMKYLSGIKDYDTEVSVSLSKTEKLSRQIVLKACGAIVLIVASAMLLSSTAAGIADSTGLGRTFIGSILLAFATSLPEIVVSVAAFRMGSTDLAIGNIFGSNMLNMFIVALCGFLKGGSPILSLVSSTHVITAAVSVLLTIIILLGLRYRKRTIFSLGFDSVIMLVVFFIGMRMIYVFK